MKISCVASCRIEAWDFRAIERGIGASEVSMIEMAQRLSRRGHDVTCYTELPPEAILVDNAGVAWRDLKYADLSEPGLWIVYRSLDVMDGAMPDTDHRYWLVLQDTVAHGWTPVNGSKFERVLALCPAHLQSVQQMYSDVGDRVCLSSNGISLQAIEQAERDELPRRQRMAAENYRDPKRLIWSSSPDRGLAELLWIFERAADRVPGLNLHVFYGLNNIEKLTQTGHDRAYWRSTYEAVERAKCIPGVYWHGRVGRSELYKAFLQSGIWCYPTWFTETSCVTCMEAQALGAIPITRPYWALAHNVKHGVFIEGDPRSSALIRCAYVENLVKMASTPTAQEMFRGAMKAETRVRCDYERVVDQWESWL